MNQEYERLLVGLALELAAAKDPAAAAAAVRAYLLSRFSPASCHGGEGIPEDFPEGCIHTRSGARDIFILPLTVPQHFVLNEATRDKPSAYELNTVEKLLQYFRERHEGMVELKGLTFTDDLTGLYNQRYLELILDRELALARRNATPFSVLFLDLDHFKSVNDTHGHLVGSRLLSEVGAEIKKTLRESDITFRYGGDEFVIVLANTNIDDAMMVAERVRAQIEKKRFLARDKLDIRLTASIGVASYPDHALTKKDILRAADEALYGVKRAVRNKVIAAVIRDTAGDAQKPAAAAREAGKRR